MPLTRDNIESCVMRTQLAIESVSAEDQARMNGNNAYASQVIKRIAVSPIEMSGYDYNMTVKALADVIAQGRLPEDVAHKKGMLFLFLTIAQSSDHLLAYKFITTDTKLSINNALSH